MTRPYEQWPSLWQWFIALYETWADDYADEAAAISDGMDGWSEQELRKALAEWHQAFDGASDEQVAAIVGDFNPHYDPTRTFGGDRQWAEWVRAHIEAELARRNSS